MTALLDTAMGGATWTVLGPDEVFLTVIQADGSFKAVDRLQKPGT